MESCHTLTQRSSLESTLCDDNYTQTSDLESAQPLLHAHSVSHASNGKAGRQNTSEPVRSPEPQDSDEVLIIKGLGIGREAVLCGVLLVVFM